MAEKPEEITEAEATAKRRPGGAVPGRPRKPPASDETLSPQARHLKAVGQALFGTHWQSDFAREVGYSKAQITRWLKDQRKLPPTLNFTLQQMVLERLVRLSELLASDMMGAKPEINQLALMSAWGFAEHIIKTNRVPNEPAADLK